MSLGKALIRSRFNKPAKSERHSKSGLGAQFENDYTSITQQNDLETFLANATLANTDFTAEKINLKIVPLTYQNPFLLTDEKLQETLSKQERFRDKLAIPKRPYWDANTTREELDQNERAAFLEWRRNLVMLEEDEGLLMTPYERNLQVWRQLWRVIERSDLVVQIVDARDPTLFRCADLEAYVIEKDVNKKNLLLVNKADMVSKHQRKAWADYFTKNNITFVFFSAAMAQIELQKEAEEELSAESTTESQIPSVEVLDQSSNNGNEASELNEPTEEKPFSETSQKVPLRDENTEIIPKNTIRILSVHELILLFSQECPFSTKQKIIGFVGYPNVGKSSTINALLGAKKVTVSSTPGKTKHFQTLALTPELMLCDCPGLVFPSFSTTKGHMVLSGILPIDQLREYTAPITLLVKRIPAHILAKIYGITIVTNDKEGEHQDREATFEEFLRPFARSRGYTKASQGNPDESRASRHVLKDYGKILYVNKPPGYTGKHFHKDSETRMLSQKKYLHSVPVNKAMNKVVLEQGNIEARVQGSNYDAEVAFKRVLMPFGEGKKLAEKEMEKGDAGKKHFKAKKGKTRDYWTRDYNY